MAAKGAEVLLLPIWGGNETLAKARAIENHVFLISSSYDMKTFMLDPEGKVLAEASAERPVAIAQLRLDEKRVPMVARRHEEPHLARAPPRHPNRVVGARDVWQTQHGPQCKAIH